MTDWRIYYDDGSIASSEESYPHTCEKNGVQVIVQDDVAFGFRLLTNDYYLWSYQDERWYGADLFGLFDYLQQNGQKVVLFGRSVPEERFEEIYQTACNDPLLPDKEGFRERERMPESVELD